MNENIETITVDWKNETDPKGNNWFRIRTSESELEKIWEGIEDLLLGRDLRKCEHCSCYVEMDLILTSAVPDMCDAQVCPDCEEDLITADAEAEEEVEEEV